MTEMTLAEYQAKYGRKAQRSVNGRRSQRKGKVGENIADWLLQDAGVQMVERIATPVVIIARRGDWVKIRYKKKVSGDRRGVMDDGRRVLAEVKARDRNLRWSDLQQHQRDALDENDALGAVSLLVWIHRSAYHILRWPIAGFAPRRSITLERAAELEWDRKS